MTTIAIHRTRNGVLQSAESATIAITDSAGSYVVTTTPVVPVSAGIYSYAANALTPGSYTAIWTFSNAGYADDVIKRSFTLDPAQAMPSGVTLMAVERQVARRIGPYRRLRASQGSTVNRLSSSVLVSSLNLGSYEDQFLLRRGTTWGQGIVPNFVADDRTRLIADYDTTNGWLEIDRPWTVAPDYTNVESVEVMYLDPDEELRPSVLDGLSRCFFWDSVAIGLTSSISAYNVNLSSIVPWLTDPAWVREVRFSYMNQRLPPTHLDWWRVYQQGKDIFLWSEGGFIGNFLLDVLRPVSSYVNEEISITGPNDDLDTLYVDLDYAAWAGVLELWKNFPERIQPLTVQNLRPSRQDAANEFTKHSLRVANLLPQRPMIRYGQTDITTMQIGNLAEPV